MKDAGGGEGEGVIIMYTSRGAFAFKSRSTCLANDWAAKIAHVNKQLGTHIRHGSYGNRGTERRSVGNVGPSIPILL